MIIAHGNFVPCSTLERDMTGRRSDASGAPMQGNAAGMGQDNGFWVERQQEARELILIWEELNER